MTEPETPYRPPMVIVRAGYAATDGRMAEYVNVEWQYAPRPADVREVVALLGTLPQKTYGSADHDLGALIEVTSEAPGIPSEWGPLHLVDDSPARPRVPNVVNGVFADDEEGEDDDEPETEVLPRPICRAAVKTAAGDHIHRCGSWAGHVAITEQAPHACANCGTLFDPETRVVSKP